MIELYYWPTPNCAKVAIMLEECGMPYTLHPVRVGNNEQKRPEYLRINPNARIPAIVDTEPMDGKGRLPIFESGAILLYLAEKSGLFGGEGFRRHGETVQWLMWQMSGLGPMAGQHGHFLLYAKERIPYAIDRYASEVRRLYGVLEQRLKQTGDFVVGGEYTVADMSIFPWVRTYKAQHIPLEDYPNVQGWYRRMSERSAIRRAIDLGRELTNPADEAQARKVLFGHAPYTESARTSTAQG